MTVPPWAQMAILTTRPHNNTSLHTFWEHLYTHTTLGVQTRRSINQAKGSQQWKSFGSVVFILKQCVGRTLEGAAVFQFPLPLYHSICLTIHACFPVSSCESVLQLSAQMVCVVKAGSSKSGTGVAPPKVSPRVRRNCCWWQVFE